MLELVEHHIFYKKNEDFLERLRSVQNGHFTALFDHAPTPIYYRGNKEKTCLAITFSNDKAEIENSYYIGLDWIRPWNMPVMVEPKVNIKDCKLNHVGMLLEALIEPDNFNHLDGLMEINFEEEWIEVDSTTDIQLTPFLLSQFLATVRSIVRKGIKKDYYSVTENLNSRVKGKILVGQQVRQNIVRNRLTNTVCTYQEFGIDTEANRFLKYVLHFVSAQLENFGDNEMNESLFEMLRYNLAAFQLIRDERFNSLKKTEQNPFYKEYNIAIDLGNQILRLLDHDLLKATDKLNAYPPHWIDMSKLFELFVFKKLKEQFPGENEVIYHFTTHRQELDFIIHRGDFKAVVDAKYKPRYSSGNPSMADARQLAGYTRLESVYKELNINTNEIIPVYFIYPSQLKEPDLIEENLTNEEFQEHFSDTLQPLNTSVRKSKAYREMYLQEIDLPTRNN